MWAIEGEMIVNGIRENLTCFIVFVSVFVMLGCSMYSYKHYPGLK
ncbi:hypothetical protein SAMN05216514_10748 [Kandleria vitulina]|nr:hypothetical protein SAMN05216514_10748 [Kandleria vitulina]